MANITDVKLPDNSQYDLKDNVSGYAKKVAGATTDDLASLTATGDLADSGKKLSDLVLKSDVKDVLNSTSTTDPLSANMGRALADNLAANENVYGAKNLIPFPYYRASPYTSNDVTFTVNADKSISLSGTATADTYYQLNANTFADMYIGLNVTASVDGCISGITFYGEKDSATVFNTNSNVTFVVPSYNSYLGLYIEVKSGTVTDGVTVYPMIRDARILDDTFVPYAPTNREAMSFRANGKVGAKNLNSLPYYESVKSENGITITSDDKGIVTASGTASALVALYMHSDTIATNKLVLPKGDYTLSGCPVGGSQDTYCLRVNFGGTLYYDIGSGVNFTLAADTQIEIAVIIKSGTALPVGGITIKPMIRIAEDTDPSFAPFAMTNRELTKLSSEQKYTNGSLSLYKKGNLVTLVTNGWVDVTSGNVYIPDGFRPYLYAFATVWGSNGLMLCQIADTGTIQLFETYPTAIDDHFLGSMSWYTT